MAEFPAGTFLENIAIGEGGTIYVNSYLKGKVYRIGSDWSWTLAHDALAGAAARLGAEPKPQCPDDRWQLHA